MIKDYKLLAGVTTGPQGEENSYFLWILYFRDFLTLCYYNSKYGEQPRLMNAKL